LSIEIILTEIRIFLLRCRAHHSKLKFILERTKKKEKKKIMHDEKIIYCAFEDFVLNNNTSKMVLQQA